MAVEVVGAQGRDGQCAGLGPVHSRSLEANPDQLACCGLDHSRADLPTGRAITCIVGAPATRLEVVQEFPQVLLLAPRPTSVLIPEPLDESVPAAGSEMSQGFLRPRLG